MVQPQPQRGQSATLALPSVQTVAQAVQDAGLRKLPARTWVNDRRVFLEVSGGVLRVYAKLSPGSDGKQHFSRGLSKQKLDAIARAETDCLNRPMALYDAHTVGTNDIVPIAPSPEWAWAHGDGHQLEPGRPQLEAVKTGRMARRNWSTKSRARMTLRMGQFDYTPLFEDDQLPALLTATMPGNGWEQCTPNARVFKEKVAKFQREYARAWGAMPQGVWKMEFQERGAPHLHLLLTPPQGYSRGFLHAKDANGDPSGHLVWKTNEAGQPTDELASLRTGGLFFNAWFSLTWAKIVGVHKLPARPASDDAIAFDPIVEFRKHVNAGTQVSRRSIERYADPKRIAVYFSKHGAYKAKEYQNQMPQLWLDAIDEGAPSANFWGAWQLEKTNVAVELGQIPEPLPARKPIRPHYVSSDIDGGESRNEYVALVGLRITASTPTWQAEDAASWSTDKSVLRQYARDLAVPARPVSDLVKVERHLRKLARAQAVTQRRQTIRNGDGTTSSYRYVDDEIRTRGDGSQARRPKALMRTRVFRSVDQSTGEVTFKKKRTRGYYDGGSGYLLVNDGRVSAAHIGYLLAGKGPGNRLPRTRYGLAA